jgi:21S rRNA (GM2251-2'-O)-methyltransferase
LHLYEAFTCRALHSQCRRAKSTTSAINAGLRAEREGLGDAGKANERSSPRTHKRHTEARYRATTALAGPLSRKPREKDRQHYESTRRISEPNVDVSESASPRQKISRIRSWLDANFLARQQPQSLETQRIAGDEVAQISAVLRSLQFFQQSTEHLREKGLSSILKHVLSEDGRRGTGERKAGWYRAHWRGSRDEGTQQLMFTGAGSYVNDCLVFDAVGFVGYGKEVWEKEPRQEQVLAVLKSAERSTQGRDKNEQKSERIQADKDDGMPIAIPYSTAASQFLYGTNVVLAALRAQRRKLYRLYVRPSSRNSDDQPDQSRQTIDRLAKKSRIPLERHPSLQLLDRLSEGRPHNGLVLEASPLPFPPVLGLGRPNERASTMPLTLDQQSAEDTAINGTPYALPSSTTSRRRPFVVMLDGILDEGNMGSILRTAHFFGVDAVAVATGTCCSVNSAIVAKASSGACEAVRLLDLPKPSSFVYESKKAGWIVYAAVAPAVPGVASAVDVKRSVSSHDIATVSPLLRDPVLLMLGAEGEGLRANLVRQADRLISIDHGGRGEIVPNVGVDSLNVSVAAGVLIEAFLQSTRALPDQHGRLQADADKESHT